MPELTDIDGVGPTTAESLRENDIDSVEEVASTESSTLADDVDHVTENTASKIVLSAQDLVETDDEPSEEEILGEEFAESVEGSESDSERVELEDDPEVSEDDETSENESEEPETATVDLDVDPYQEQLFTTALVKSYVNRRRSNPQRADALRDVLEQLEDGSTVEVDGLALNTVYSAVRQEKTFYQGKSLTDEMNLMSDLQEQIQEYRDEHSF